MNVVIALMFYPRGGSAFAVRGLIPQLVSHGWCAQLAAGSLGSPGQPTHAATFFNGFDLVAHDYTPAVAAFEAGRDPMAEPVPMHPSYECRPDVPDRDLSLVDPGLAALQAAAWRITFDKLHTSPDVVHLNHLTPLTDAARTTWPHCPIVTSLHGTELKWMARQLQPGAKVSRRTATSRWITMMQGWAHLAQLVTVVSEPDAAAAERLLHVNSNRIQMVASGVDLQLFHPLAVDPRQRMSAWRKWLVEEPRGWDESCIPGSVRYTDRDLGEFIDVQTGAPKPVLIFVGRFTAVKRLSCLLSAYTRLRSRLGVKSPPLVVWGGMPGEWEGEHPVSYVRRHGVRGVFFAGSRGHDQLPLALGCSDLLVAPSVNESFGHVYIEALACGIPVVATRSGGPATFLDQSDTHAVGWLVEPDDCDGLVDALTQAVNSPEERRRRGSQGRALVYKKYSWPHVARHVVQTYNIARSSWQSSAGNTISMGLH